MKITLEAYTNQKNDTSLHNRLRTVGSLLFLSVVIVTLSACGLGTAIRVPDNAPPAWVTFGPDIDLNLNLPIYYSGSFDGNGKVHFLAEASESNELTYMVIDKNGISERTRIKMAEPLTPGSSFRVFFDHEGDVHFLRGAEHYKLKDGMPQKQPREYVLCERLVMRGNDVFCSYVAARRGAASKVQGDWTTVPPASIWPWDSFPRKLVVVKKADDGWFKPVVVNPDTKHDATQYALAADDMGNVHVFSCDMRNIFGVLNYTLIKKEQLEITAQKEPPSERVAKVSGESQGSRNFGLLGVFNMAVDPRSGVALIANEDPRKLYIIKDGWRKQELNAELSQRSIILLYPAGEKQFHILGNQTQYLICDERTCSIPITTAEDHHYAGIIADGYGKALLVMVRKNSSISVRWIDVKK